MTPQLPALKNIDLKGYKLVTAVGDLSDYKEVTQMTVFLILGLIVMGMIANTGFGGNSYDLLVNFNHYLPIAAYATVILMIGMVFYFRSRAKAAEIKIVGIDDHGFQLGRRKIDDGYLIAVPWWDVLAAEAVLEGRKNYTIYIATRSKNLYKLYWHNAFAWNDAEPFFSKMKTHAPEAILNIVVGDIEVSNQDTRYTNLWLQYFSSPDTRKRKETLVPGDFVNDNRYEIIERLGGGGQGIAYLARADANDYLLSQRISHDSGNLVVLKEFILPVHRGAVLSEEKETLLNREAEILSGIDHPSIVRMLDCFVEDYRGYLVLEYVAGDTLKQSVEKNGKASEAEVISIGLAVCEILAYLHNMFPPIIHRDVTPDNLIGTKGGGVKLVDFTVAHQFESKRTATVVGKQCYMPPEQFRGQPTPESDIYALGCTLYFLLTGCDPEPMQTSKPREAVCEVSAALDAIVQKATAFDASDRYNHVLEMADDLRRCKVAKAI